MTNTRLVQKLSRRVPSPAMVVACVALIVALGGTSYAAIRLPANSVGTKQLKRGAVTGVKVRKNALTGAQINESSLGQVRSAASADNAASSANAVFATNAEKATAADRAPLARLDYREGAGWIIPPTGFIRATKNCESGLRVVGGGGKLSEPNTSFIIDTNPIGRAGWEVTAARDPGATGTATLTIYVICAQAASTTP